MIAIEHIAEIDSTNSELTRRALCGGAQAVHGVALVADHQVAGRGQRGRAWRDSASEPGASLLLSVGWACARTIPLDGLSLSLGLALREALAPLVAEPARLAVKWPNDLLYASGKCGGVLVETVNPVDAAETRVLVVGIGLNLTAVPVLGTADAQRALPPRALFPEAAPGMAPVLRERVLKRLLPALGQCLERFEQRGFAADREAFEARMAWLGELAVFVRPAGETLRGRIDGVAADGALRLVADGAPLTLHSGELRRACPAASATS
ncbi:MAG: biotin--[acetyl-CoA-carboxylase] ligase [Casimicrobiaceae bacterium]